ncbi:related to CTR2 - Protein involved in copper transport [Melanopsichium pennsylvanicum]|uniref:Copper transport protein n=1 Tax=Melanopsichium pennsylvanicum TaxID=63383 RepID=A0AAJ4XNG3_9BASI|nr:related to CTR2 - Protein involved in copper transport [Melanopsichium pennsylvanicum]
MDHGGHGDMPSGGHGGMNHGGSDHGGMDMGKCNMNMVWNWDKTNLCILTSSWHITTPFSLYVSLTFIAFCGVIYEYLRLYIRTIDSRLARTSPCSSLASTHRRRASLLLPTSNPGSASSSTSSNGGGLGIGERRSGAKRRSLGGTRVMVGREAGGRWINPLETSRRVQLWRSTLYATSVGISFVLMLIAMTFNAWVILAIVVGAGLGHYWFNRDVSSTSALLGGADDKGLACHT